MSTELYSPKKAAAIFESRLSADRIQRMVGETLPAFARSHADNRLLKSWSLGEMPLVGEKIGFLRRPLTPMAIALFVTKGGVLKTSLTLNLARVAALHNIRTCVVGLDMQGDATTTLGPNEPSSNEDFTAAMERLNQIRGLADVFMGQARLEEVIIPTALPTLSYIAETPELVAFDQGLLNKNRREYWLREKVVEPLKESFDLILMDCSPNWNRLITNALTACDLLISPLECKINNFRNLKIFQGLLTEFREELHLSFNHLFVPTRLSPARRLSSDIYKWYRANLKNCAQTAIRDSIQGEEAMALRTSVVEYAPTCAAAEEMRSLLREVWEVLRVPKHPGFELGADNGHGDGDRVPAVGPSQEFRPSPASTSPAPTCY